MLSPSHPGPHKATHLSMCDRTVNDTSLVAWLLVSNLVDHLARCVPRLRRDIFNEQESAFLRIFVTLARFLAVHVNHSVRITGGHSPFGVI